jgi:hypothetical protein
MGATAVPASVASMAATHGDGGAESGDSHGSAQPSRHEHSEQPDSKGCSCTCIDNCSLSAPVAVLPVATTLRVVTVEVPARRVFHTRTFEEPLASADRRLPFPNGPPAARLS